MHAKESTTQTRLTADMTLLIDKPLLTVTTMKRKHLEQLKQIMGEELKEGIYGDLKVVGIAEGYQVVVCDTHGNFRWVHISDFMMHLARDNERKGHPWKVAHEAAHRKMRTVPQIFAD